MDQFCILSTNGSWDNMLGLVGVCAADLHAFRSFVYEHSDGDEMTVCSTDAEITALLDEEGLDVISDGSVRYAVTIDNHVYVAVEF